MEWMKVGDIEMCYSIVGEGPPLVMIMGYTAHMEMWGPTLIDALSSEHTLLLFDNRGAGRTTAGSRLFTMKRFADDTALLMAELGIRKADVLGGSMGGMIAQEVALCHPDKVDRLVLCCTTCGGIHQKFAGLDSMKNLADRSGTPEERIRNSMPFLFPRQWMDENTEKVEAAVRLTCLYPIETRVALKQMGALVLHNTYKRLPAIQSDTLVICGDCDLIVPPRNSEILVESIPGAALKVFAGGGHAFPMQFPAEVAAEVNAFLAP